MKAYPHYNWVSFEFRIRKYGMIMFAVTNDEHNMWGPYVTKERMQKQRDAGKIKFKAWRIVLDKCYENDDTFKENREKTNLLSEKVAEYLISKGYELIQTHELFKTYYED